MNEIMDTMATHKARTRRNHTPELKAQILAACDHPGASVAKVAMAHGINANIVHSWRRLAREGKLPTAQAKAQFVPVTVDATTAQGRDDPRIEIELRRGALSMKLSWPLASSRELASWTRELLR